MWMLEQWPRYGTNYDFFPISGIVDYDSDNTFYDYKEDKSQHFIGIMIPEFEIIATEKQSALVNKYIETIINNKLPILRNLQKKDLEYWAVDTIFLEYYLKSKNIQ